MKKHSSMFVALCLVLALACASSAFTPGTYEGTGKGYSEGAPVKVKVTVDAEKITAVEIDAPEEVPFGVQNFENYAGQLIGKSEAKIDAASNATRTAEGVTEAAAKALAQAKGENTENTAPVSFTPGEYTGTFEGYNGPVEVKVTFGKDKVTAIDVAGTQRQHT